MRTEVITKKIHIKVTPKHIVSVRKERHNMTCILVHKNELYIKNDTSFTNQIIRLSHRNSKYLTKCQAEDRI